VRGPPVVPATSRAVGTREALLRSVPDRPGVPPVPHFAIRAKVAGLDTLLIVDTGATASGLDSALVARAKLEVVDSGVRGRDWTGQPIKILRTDAPIALEGIGPVPDRASGVAEFSPGFRARGLGGVLSPQALANATDDVLIDFPGRRLLVRPMAAREVPIGLAPGPAPEPLCADRSGGVEGTHLTILALVNGTRARLAVDTGLSDTTLFASAAAAVKFEPPPPPPSGSGDAPIVGGTPLGGSKGMLRKATLAAGDWSTVIDIAVVDGTPSSRCPFDGRLGIDVLRSCAIEIANGASIVRCPSLARP